MEVYIAIALSALAVVLLIILLLRPSGGRGLAEKLAVTDEKLNELSDTVGDEFERSRRELQALQRDQRSETVQSLQLMNEKLESMNRQNADYQAKLIRSLNSALVEISRSNAESAEKMRKSNEEKLEQMRLTVGEKLDSTLNARLDSSFKTVSAQLENVYRSIGEMKELSGSVTENVTALNRVLTNVKARGTWAEIQLGGILDQTVPGMYETNFESSPGSGERVEFAVKIPSAEGKITYLPVDSKFPMEDYVRVCTAADEADAAALSAARKALEDRVIAEAKAVAKYIAVPRTTPYAILYLATDALFAEIISSKRGIAEKIRSELNVMIAGPTTITALLNSLSMGFRAVAINEKANEVRLLLGTAKAQYDKFGVVLEKAKRKIDEAGRTLEDAQKRNDIIRSKLKTVDSPDALNEENEEKI